MAPVNMISCEMPGESSRSPKRVTLRRFSWLLLGNLAWIAVLLGKGSIMGAERGGRDCCSQGLYVPHP